MSSAKSSVSVKVLLFAIAVAVFLNIHEVIFDIGFILNYTVRYEYWNNPLYRIYHDNMMSNAPYVDPLPIPEISLDEYSRERMLELSNNFRSPIVIRGGLANSTSVRDWNMDYFLSKYEDERLLVREIKNKSDTSFGDVYIQSRSFQEYLTMKAKGRDVQVVASSKIFYNNKELNEDCASPIDNTLTDLRGNGVEAQQFFVGSGGTLTAFHSEAGHNVYKQICGSKTWTVVAPKWNYMFSPSASISGASVVPSNLGDNNKRGDIVGKIPRYSSTLYPGDMLMNPPWWYHEVYSHGPFEESLFSVAGRVRSVFDTMYNSPILFTYAVWDSMTKSSEDMQQVKSAEEFGKNMQDNVEISWIRNCQRAGRTDCITEA